MAETANHHIVPCFGHVFKAVFIISLIVILINLSHIFAAVRHEDYYHIPAPSISVFCYVCIILALCTWIHHLFYFEFFLNALALPIKIVLSVMLLFNSIDLLETNIEELYPSSEITRDVVHTLRAVAVLIGVVLELYVFRLCQKAHHLMKSMERNEGKRHFSVRKFLTAKEFISHGEEKKPPIVEETKMPEKTDERGKVEDINLPV